MSEGLKLPKVNGDDRTPKYLQARKILMDAIQSGQLAPGAKLPSTLAIGSLINVSLITAHKALEGLVRSGWLRREVGRGTYVRDDLDSALARPRSLSVGILFDRQVHVNIDDYYHSTIVNGLRLEARAATPPIEFFFRDGFDLHGKDDQNLGAICIHPPLENQSEVERLAQRYPVIVLGGAFPDGQVATVDCDNVGGGREAVRHLIGLGHRRFMVLSGPMNLSNARDRAEGACTELAAQGIHVGARSLPVSQDSVVLDERTQALIQTGLAEPDRPTAIIAGGYYLALAAMQVARGAGLSIPGDLSVIGFDDPISAQLLNPPLTTVRQPLAEMAGQACRLLRDAILCGHVDIKAHVLPTELIVRGSTSRARTD